MEVEAAHVPSKFEYGCYALHAQTPWNLSDEVTCIHKAWTLFMVCVFLSHKLLSTAQDWPRTEV